MSLQKKFLAIALAVGGASSMAQAQSFQEIKQMSDDAAATSLMTTFDVERARAINVYTHAGRSDLADRAAHVELNANAIFGDLEANPNHTVERAAHDYVVRQVMAPANNGT